MGSRGGATARAALRSVGPDFLFGLAVAGVAALLLGPAAQFAQPLLLDFGPNDADYVRGFRQDWERDGLTRFHWTTQAANVMLPVRVAGEGLLLRFRYRRHFVEAAKVRLIVEGRTVATFEAAADQRVAYKTFETALPRLEGRHPFVLSIEAPSDIERPLGLALDWLELERRPGTRFRLLAETVARFAAIALAAFLLPRIAGASRSLCAAHALAVAGLGACGASYDLLAFERVVQQGSAAYLAAGCVALLLVRFGGSARLIGAAGRGTVAGALVACVLVALAIRYVLLLHPRFYYPDVRIHSLFALALARRGFESFWDGYLASQYQLSLGLQQVGERWYAMPYPPGLYVAASPLIAILHYRPEVAVSLVASTVNSLEALVVFAIGRRLGLGTPAALASGAVLPLLPVFLARLSLAYFPAIFGHAFDALVVAYLAGRSRAPAGGRQLAVLSGLLSLCLLAYTQSALNFAVLFALLVLTEGLAGAPGWRSRAAVLLGASIVAGALSFALVYSRYVPTLKAMAGGQAAPEERILVERLEREERARAARNEKIVPEEDDPHSGPGLDLLRGLRKAGWRLFVFYGAFAPIAVLALWRLARSLPREEARFVGAWAATYVCLNLASGGLPGPNLVRYNKDLEIVAPLVCLALGAGVVRLWQKRTRTTRLVALTASAAWIVFGASRALQYLTERFVLEK